MVTDLTVDCTSDAVLSIVVSDDRGLGVVDITAAWNDDTRPFLDDGGGVYSVRVRADQLPPDPFTFVVSGTAEDLAGNVTTIADSADCTPPDVTPPQVSRLTVDCDGPVVLSVQIVDDRTEKLAVDIVADWNEGSAPFTRMAGRTYGVELPTAALPDGTVIFTVTGTAADPSGNTTSVTRTGSCSVIN